MAKQVSKGDKATSQSSMAAPPAAHKKPTIASVLTIVGGVIIILVAALLYFSVAALSNPTILKSLNNTINLTKYNVTNASQLSGFVAQRLGPTIPIGFITGIALVIVGVLMYTSDSKRIKIAGILAIVLAAISYFGGGGLFIGMILGIIGGVLALVRKG